MDTCLQFEVFICQARMEFTVFTVCYILLSLSSTAASFISSSCNLTKLQ